MLRRALLGDLGEAISLDSLQDIGGVTALEGIDAGIVHLPHGGADLIEEPSVMGYHKQRSLALMPALFEVAREPIDGAHVKMVRWLVEQQSVVGAYEQAGEVDAPALPAGELAHLALPGHVSDEPA